MTANRDVLNALLADGNNIAPTFNPTFTGQVTHTNPPKLPSYLKTALPSAAAYTGCLIYVSNATGKSVTGSLAHSNGTSWIDVTTGVAVV